MQCRKSTASSLRSSKSRAGCCCRMRIRRKSGAGEFARCSAGSIVSGFAAVLRKDLRLELRSGESTLALLALSMLVLVVLVFALDAARVRSVDAAAGALWVAMVFAGMLGAIRGLLLSPLDPATLYAAKLAAAFIFMAVAEVGAVILMVLFFNLDFDGSTVRLAPILVLGAIGFSALATLLSAITGRTRGGDMLLPILAVPIFVPALIAGVKASAATLAGAPFAAMGDWLKIMIAFDVLFVTAGYLLFEYVIGQD